MKVDTVFLLITNLALNQLYHELLSSSGFETVTTDNFDVVSSFLIINTFKAVIIFDDNQIVEIEKILEVRKKFHCWQNTKIIIISADDHFPFNINHAIDLILNPLTLSPGKIVAKIDNDEVAKNPPPIPKTKRETS